MYKINEVIVQKKDMDFHASEYGDKILPVGTRWQIVDVLEENESYRVKIIEDLEFTPKSSAVADISFLKEFF